MRHAEFLEQLISEYELKELYAGPPSSEGWEDWIENHVPQLHRARVNARRLVNLSESKREPPRVYAGKARTWCELVREGMLTFHAVAPDLSKWETELELPQFKKTLFFDLETQKSIQTVGGMGNAGDLLMSFGAVFELPSRELRVYGPMQAEQLIEDLCTADLVVGFNHLHFDYAVLRGYQPDAPFLDRVNFDMLVDCHAWLHIRPSLGSLITPTLNASKLGSGLDALDWWRALKCSKIVEYLVGDVRYTFELFAHGVNRGHVVWQSPRRAEGNTLLIPTPHWVKCQQSTTWQGQVDLNGEVTCPHDKKRKSSRFASPGGG